MRGVIVLMTALFVLAPYYMIMSMAFEPLAEVILTFDLSVIDGASSINTLKSILYLWGPMIYVAGWFVWAVRYYMSPNRFIGARGA